MVITQPPAADNAAVVLSMAVAAATAVADLATRSPAADLLDSEPVPSRRQVAAIFRTLADHTHNAHMVAVATSAAGRMDAVALADYLTTIALHIATERRPATSATTVAGKHAGDRILDHLQWRRGDLDLRGETRPASRQVAPVLAAMGDPVDLPLTRTLISDEVFEFGADRDRFGPQWQLTTGIGRFFHALADYLADADDTAPSTP